MLCGTGATGVTQILLLVVLARFAGGADTVGTYGIAAAVVAIFRTGSEMGLRQFIASESHLFLKYKSYKKLREISIGVTLFGSLAFCVWWSRDFSEIALMTGVILLRLSESGEDIAYGVLQRVSWAQAQSVSMIVRASLVLFAITLGCIVSGQGWIGMVCAAILSWTWVLTFDRIQARNALDTLREEEPENKQLSDIVALLRLSWPIGAGGLMNSAAQAVPRFILDITYGRAAVGLWTAAYAIGQSLGLVNQAVLASVMGKLGETYTQLGIASFSRDLRKVLLSEVALVLFLIPIAYLVAPPIVTSAYGSEFVIPGLVLLVILISKIFDVAKSYLKFAHLVKRDSMPLLLVAFLVFVISGTAGPQLIPKWGLEGAASLILLLSVTSFIANALFLYVRKSN